MSRHFGVEKFSYYIVEIKDFISEWNDLFPILMFTMMLFSVYQMHGCLSSDHEQSRDRFPHLFIFIFANFMTLTSIDHKEQRFTAMIWPMFAIFWAFLWLTVLRLSRNVGLRCGISNNLQRAVRLFIIVIHWIYITRELVGILKNNINHHLLDIEFYNLQPERSSYLFDYNYT